MVIEMTLNHKTVGNVVVASAVALLASAANAAGVDISAITSAGTDIAAVGAAVFAVFVGVKLFQWIRKAL